MKILICDDEANLRIALQNLLEDDGHTVVCCDTGEAAVEAVSRETFDVAFLDVVLPGINGLETLTKLQNISPHVEVLMMSGHSDLSTAVHATKLGAVNFFEKPLNPDRILIELKHIEEKLTLQSRLSSLEDLVGHEDEIIGVSGMMKSLKSAIAKAAPSDGRVMITGENGTGKELVARAVHHLSHRHHRPFISLNCAALPKDLVESELFGYEKGAFTGAMKRKPGRFELADNGTLFLDEIGDMTLEVQAKLLRVLEENEAIRLGGDRPYHFDIRIITATNKNLVKCIEENTFREDLYYRLNVILLDVPPLRSRREDIPLLAQYFLEKLTHRSGQGLRLWDQSALTALQEYDWPGNVRELRNFVERLVIMGEGDVINGDMVRMHFPAAGGGRSLSAAVRDFDGGDENSLKNLVNRYEKSLLAQCHRECGGNVSRMARILKTDRANLHRKLKYHGIK